MTPAERRDRIVELVERGPVTVAWLARSLEMLDRSDLVIKDLQILRRSGSIRLHKVRHAAFKFGQRPTEVVMLVAFKIGSPQGHHRSRQGEHLCS